MKLRRAAIAVAATIGLALSAAAPAMADHAPDPEFMKGNPTCDDVADKFEIEGLVSLGKVDYDEGDEPETIDVDPAAYEGYEILVIVKGGPGAHVFFEPPFHELYAPNNRGGNQADISHYEVCGVKADEEPPGEEPPGEEPPGEEPPGEEPPGEEPPGEEPPGEKPAKPDTTPAPVPTSVPAGYGDSASFGAGGTVGLLAALTVALAAGAALVRRRFGHES